ncbi:MAG: DUF6062 family protein [Treponema sp.]|jgi:hypothetical protein|nr:DUF6062 family protein [Treponema sp.]
MAVERHINFFELEKAAAQQGCPLCRIIADRAQRYIDIMLFEHVGDRGFRALHRKAGGFCAYHSRSLESYRDGLAVAILGRDILVDRLECFKKRKPWKPAGRCPLCVEQDNIEHEYLGFLVQIPDTRLDKDDAELKEIFLASDGLCAPHYERLQHGFKRVPSWLLDFQNGKYEELLRRTDVFIELSAYGRQDEFRRLDEKDQLVWKELAVNLRGGG